MQLYIVVVKRCPEFDPEVILDQSNEIYKGTAAEFISEYKEAYGV